MPDNYYQWAWWWFFVIGSLGGLCYFFVTIASYIVDKITAARLRRWSSDYDFTGEYDDPKFGAPMARTRANMPVYTPRKREGAE